MEQQGQAPIAPLQINLLLEEGIEKGCSTVRLPYPHTGALKGARSVLSLTVPAIIIEHLCCFVKREN